MNNNKVKQPVMCLLMCAAVVMTTVFAAVPIPGVQGAYANAGDAAVYVSAFLLGWPWGVAAAAVGSAAADLLLGSTLYAPATFVIKGIMALPAVRLLKKGGMKVPKMLICGAVMTAGYFGYECIIYGADTAMMSVPANALQAVLGAVLGSIIIKGIESLQK